MLQDILFYYPITTFVFCISATLLCFIIIDLVNPPNGIATIFQIPSYPIVGNYFQLLNNPCKTYMYWRQRYNQSIYSIRLGNKRVIVVNDFEDVQILWSKSSMNSRPIQFTFHNIVSSTKGFTVGTTPFGGSFKKCKQLISSRLNEKSLNDIIETIAEEADYCVKHILMNRELNFQPSSNPYLGYNHRIHDIDLFKYFQYFTLRTSILFTYGLKLDVYFKDNQLSNLIIDIENKIIRLRSPISNGLDYFPILRWFWSDKMSNDARIQRDIYMDELLNRYYLGNLQSSNNLISAYYHHNHKNLDYSELQSVCLTMISAGLDNTPLNLNHLFGQLSHHQEFQTRAVNEIFETFKDDSLISIWDKIHTSMNCNFITALIKETLRFFTVLPLSLPRLTTKDIIYKNITIPKGTTLFMNAYAANHDEKKFDQPYVFNPDRWLFPNGELKNDQIINHFSFGKGVRMCSGNILAFKEMYIIVSKMLLLFKIKKPENESDLMDVDPFEMNSNPNGTTFEPKEFKVKLIPRLIPGSDDLFNYIQHKKF